MFAYKLHQFLFIFIVNGCYCQRRIKDGEAVKDPKNYMVYLVKSPVSPQNYDGWLCGGALVSPEYIVTSAACVSDVIHLYAVAGYDKYVRDTEINVDPCTKAKKKKVVLICTPQAYELSYEQVEKWSFIDIAVVKVETPYDFNDATYTVTCSYTPNAITINYQTKYQEPKVDAIVFGWGHTKNWRNLNDPTDLNQERLMFAPTLIQDKEECKKGYTAYNGMDQIIDKYMICTFEKGNINDAGMTILKTPPTAEGCDTKVKRLKGSETTYCENANNPEVALIETRKDIKPINQTIHNLNQTHRRNLNDITNVDVKLIENVGKNIKKNNDQKLTYRSSDIYKQALDSNSTHNNTLQDKEQRRFFSRRHGICQNDHGGPLVTWVGSHEVLIGVASVFKITEQRECIGPYLFTSTQCNGAFLDCILKNDNTKDQQQRRAICDAEFGFKLVETQISWKDHPDGPAENENNTTDSNLTYQATIDLKFEKQKPTDLHALTNMSSLSKNITSTNQVSFKTNPLSNEKPTRNTTDKNFAVTTPANLTNTTLNKNDSTLLTNIALKLLTNVTSIQNLNDLSSELHKAASTLELKSAPIDLNNVTAPNLTSTTTSSTIKVTSSASVKSTPASIQNVTSSISFNLSNITLSTVTNTVTSTVSADLKNTTTSKPTSTNQVSFKINPLNNDKSTRTTTDKNFAVATPTNLTNATLNKDDSTLLTNIALKLSTNVTSMKNLNDSSSQLNKAASTLELKSASSVDLNNITASNVTSTTISSTIKVTSSDSVKSTPATIQNVTSSVTFNLSNTTLSTLIHISKVTNAVTSTVSADLKNTTLVVVTPTSKTVS
nr:uncharacterized protein LOC110377158 [Helicoverpa armigera]